MPHRRAFTLIELLVVITIIATLMAILLPVLAGSRRQARATVGAANLRSLGQVMIIYTNDSRDQFLTPFSNRDPSNSSGAGWADAVSIGDAKTFWRFTAGDNRWHTDFFAYYWYSLLADYHGATRFREEQLSPGDGPLTILKNSNAPLIREPTALWPSSILYSPTFWSRPERFHGARPVMAADLLATITTANVTHPSAKALLWLRADFAQTSDDGAGVAWNSPRAKTWVGTADGAADQVDMNALTRKAAAGGRDLSLVPTALMGAPRSMAILGPPDHPFTDIAPHMPDGGFPAFFWSTRDGAEGRDLARQ